MGLILFLLVPIIWITLSVVLWVKKKRTGLGFSLLSFAVSAAISTWAIFQSSSSTAAVGFLFVPSYATGCALLVLIFFQLKSKALGWRVVGGLCLSTSLFFMGYGVYGGIKEKWQKVERQRISKEIQSHMQWIRENRPLKSSNETEWIKNEIRKHLNDNSFLTAAATEPYLDGEALSLIAESADISSLHGVVGHKNATAQILESIYLKHGSDPKLDVAFSMNSVTPTQILDKIYQRSPFVGLWLSSNLNTSEDTLKKIAKENRLEVLENVVRHIKSDCAILKEAKLTLANSNLYDPDGKRASLRPVLEIKIQDKCKAQ